MAFESIENPPLNFYCLLDVYEATLRCGQLIVQLIIPQT